MQSRAEFFRIIGACIKDIEADKSFRASEKQSSWLIQHLHPLACPSTKAAAPESFEAFMKADNEETAAIKRACQYMVASLCTSYAVDIQLLRKLVTYPTIVEMLKFYHPMGKDLIVKYQETNAVKAPVEAVALEKEALPPLERIQVLFVAELGKQLDNYIRAEFSSKVPELTDENGWLLKRLKDLFDKTANVSDVFTQAIRYVQASMCTKISIDQGFLKKFCESDILYAVFKAKFSFLVKSSGLERYRNEYIQGRQSAKAIMAAMCGYGVAHAAAHSVEKASQEVTKLVSGVNLYPKVRASYLEGASSEATRNHDQIAEINFQQNVLPAH